MDSVISKLQERLPAEAIQRTKKAETRKGYDTDGYGYQYVVDRFNDVLGLEWGFDYSVVNHEIGKYKSGAPYHDVTVELIIWVKEKNNFRKCAGGHISVTYADALKGAVTNAFKKTAAFWGVGRDAYAGTIDDDNKPLPDNHENRETGKSLSEIKNDIQMSIISRLQKAVSEASNIDRITQIEDGLGSVSKQLSAEQMKECRKIVEDKKTELFAKEFDGEVVS